MPTVRPAPFSFADYTRVLKDVLGDRAELRDRGIKGVVDPADALVYEKAGKLIRTRLGSSRFEKARLGMCIARSARALNESGLRFSNSSKTDAVNKEYWWMGFGGRMGLRAGKKASEALDDIVYKNGAKYANECAAGNAIAILHGVKDYLGAKDFDLATPRLQIFRWDIKCPLFEQAKRVGDLPQFWTGDHTYFANPDHDPKRSEWQGENVIYLGGGEYWGHGLGIMTADKIVDALNGLRKQGATRSARREDFELRLHTDVLDRFDVSPE